MGGKLEIQLLLQDKVFKFPRKAHEAIPTCRDFSSMNTQLI